MTQPLDLDALYERLSSVTTPLMQGGNLAILLCSHFDNPDQDQNENGWSDDAIAGYEEVLAGIKSHYEPALSELRTLGARLALLDADATVAAVARAMCVQGGFDPDECMANDGPRWTYYVPKATAALAAVKTMMGEV